MSSIRAMLNKSRLCAVGAWVAWMGLAQAADAQPTSTPAADDSPAEADTAPPAAAPAPTPPPPANRGAAPVPPAAGATPPGQYPPGQYPPGYYPPGYYPPGYYPPSYYPAPPPGYYRPRERPKVLPYREGQKIPEGYVLDEGPIKGLVIAGAIVLGVPYVIGLSIASGSEFKDESVWVILPVLGPWVALGAQQECDEDAYPYDEDCSTDEAENVGYTMSGIMQATGAALFIAGIAATRQRLLRADVAELTVAPMPVHGAHGDGYGLGAFGRF